MNTWCTRCGQPYDLSGYCQKCGVHSLIDDEELEVRDVESELAQEVSKHVKAANERQAEMIADLNATRMFRYRFGRG